jgi:hypothetical protein
MILFSTFHYHTFDFNTLKAIEQSSSYDSERMIWQTGIGTECFIHLNFISLQTVVLNSSPGLNLFEPANSTFISPINNFPLLLNPQNIKTLRAPPKIS